MKRLILTVSGTVAGLIALLSYKSEKQAPAVAALPSAGVGTSAAAPATSPTSAAPSSAATSTAGTGTKTSTSAKSSASAAAVAKSYVGSAITTRYGTVQVKVTVKNGKITNVAFIQLTADDPRSQQINSDAGPQLLQETLTNQSSQVDTISGASYTSDGYRQSLQSALDQAGIK